MFTLLNFLAQILVHFSKTLEHQDHLVDLFSQWSEVWKSFLLDKEKLLAKCKLCYEKVGTEKIMQVTGQNNLSFPRKYSNYDKTRRLRRVELSLSFAIWVFLSRVLD